MVNRVDAADAADAVNPAGPATGGDADVCYVVSYDHGGLVLWGYEHFVTHLRELLGWLDRHPDLKMGLDNEAWMYDWLAENQPAVLVELRDALAKYRGRLGIATCTYGQPLAAYLLEESNIRQIQYGIATARERLGYDVDIYSFSEHAAFPQIPQIAVGLGLRGALMRTHYLMYGYCPGYDVPIAWWQSPDGTRVACVPTYLHQERQVAGHRAQPPGPFGLTTEDTWILTRYPSPGSPKPLDAFRERFPHVRPLVATRLDDSGLKREELVSELTGRGEYRWATLEDVFDGMPAPTAVIAPTSEDFGTRMPWGYRGNELFDLSRRAEIMALTVERLAARVGAVRGRDITDMPGELRQAWKDLLVGQHHDVQIVARAGTLGRERLLASLERSRGLARLLLTSLSSSGSGGSAGSNGDFIAFNPLPWPRTEPEAELPDGARVAGPVSAPALGWALLRRSGSAAPEPHDGLGLETDHYRVRFHPEGGIELLETRGGRGVLRPGAAASRSGQLAGVIDGVPCVGVAASVTITRGPGGGFRVVERGKIGSMPYVTTWLFPREGERIDCRVSVRFDGERIGAPTTEKNDSRSCFTQEQKLRLRFYPAVDDATAAGVYDTPFGVATTRRPYVEGNYWTAVADNDGGLCIANRGTMGSVRESDGAVSVPFAFSTNYVWGAEVISGEREWALGLLPFAGPWQDAALHRRALEFAFPLLVVPGTPRETPPDFLHLDSSDLHLTALYPAEDGHTYARLFNGSESPQAIPRSASLPPQLAAVDMRHRDKGPFSTGATLRPWEILTVRLP